MQVRARLFRTWCNLLRLLHVYGAVPHGDRMGRHGLRNFSGYAMELAPCKRASMALPAQTGLHHYHAAAKGDYPVLDRRRRGPRTSAIDARRVALAVYTRRLLWYGVALVYLRHVGSSAALATPFTASTRLYGMFVCMYYVGMTARLLPRPPSSGRDLRRCGPATTQQRVPGQQLGRAQPSPGQWWLAMARRMREAQRPG